MYEKNNKLHSRRLIKPEFKPTLPSQARPRSLPTPPSPQSSIAPVSAQSHDSGTPASPQASQCNPAQAPPAPARKTHPPRGDAPSAG
ncbi:hypothetical protein AYI68_g3226 [Smittium mucronatum]|uniref:Uncharacterized protein n=1 Tax=Smittium mucronatum TaxID=133383 RepID=A0A1R0H0K3_9FUNG|nr:hypothetical protein AYI68_g3226 [Smittium mucronatum]